MSIEVRRAAENVVNFARVAPQWWIPGVIYAGLTGYIECRAVEDFSSGRTGRFIEGTAIGIVCVIASVVCEYTAFKYLKDYQKMKRIFLSHGWNQRIVRDRINYYCGWRTAKMAAIDSGFGREFDEYHANPL